jgi:hypothetical protein
MKDTIALAAACFVTGVILTTSGFLIVNKIDQQSRMDFASGCYAGVRLAGSVSRKDIDQCAAKAGFGSDK